MRHDGRAADAIRRLSFKRKYTCHSAGSVLVRMGETVVLCTCGIELGVPPFLVGSGKGWLTAEYNMLPGSTSPRKSRDRAGKVDGRSVEIQRLIGRSLRSIVNLEKLGERTLAIDCDVLQADGGTRTASINGAYVALVDALASLKLHKAAAGVLKGSVAAVSVGIVDGRELLDLDYSEDKDADVDMNLVMTGEGQYIELQGTGEEATFSHVQLERLLKLGKLGIEQITKDQRKALGTSWLSLD